MIGSTKPDPSRPMLVGGEGLYVTGDDHLLLTSSGSVASITLTLAGRVLTVDGRPAPFAQTHTANSARTTSTQLARLTEGWLQNVRVGVTSGSPSFGRVWARVDLVRGDGTGRTVLATLLQGVIGVQQPLAWPGSPMALSRDLPGWLRLVTGTNPAAGVEISEAVPTGGNQRLKAIIATLVTDATVANREPALVLDNGSSIFARVPAGQNQAASLTRTYCWFPGAQAQALASDLTVVASIPDVLLDAAWRLRTITTNIQAGDDWGAPVFVVEEHLGLE
jgi:hypothetical protein